MKITPNDALLVIDVQNDFCPGGALGRRRRRCRHRTHPPRRATLPAHHPHPGLAHPRPQFLRLRPPRQKALRADRTQLRRRRPSGPTTASRALTAPTSTPHSNSPVPNSSCAKASAQQSTPTPPSSKTTAPPPPVSPAISANAASPASSSPASPTTTASATRLSMPPSRPHRRHSPRRLPRHRPQRVRRRHRARVRPQPVLS